MRQDRKYAYLLAIIAVLILVIGSILRPRKVSPEISISAAEVSRLERLAQRQNLRKLADYFGEFAAGPANHVVRLRGADRSGVAWKNPGAIATSAAGLPSGGLRVVAPGLEEYASIQTSSPHIPVATLQLQVREAPPPAPVAESPASHGDWIVAVARRADGELLVSPGLHSGVVLSPCGDTAYEQLVSNIPLNRELTGAGVFDLDGNLLGIVTDCGSRLAALTVKAVGNAIDRAQSPVGKLLSRYGWKLVPLSARAAQYFSTVAGLLVEEVWAGTPADRAGIIPGDILLAADDSPVSGEAEAAALAQRSDSGPVPILITRFGREMRLRIQPDTAPRETGAAGIVLSSGLSGVEIASVNPGSSAYQAGMRSGDRLLRIGSANNPPAAALEKLLAGPDGPVFAVFQRGALRKGVFLTR